jgi:chromosomal replication initiation ATPase DnaA
MSELHRQQQNVSDVRARLLNPANTLDRRKLNAATETISMLNALVSDLNATAAGHNKEVERLNLNIADLHATIIAQARKIGELENSGDPEIAYRRPVKLIVEEVLREYPGITWQDIVSAKRTKYLIEPRHRCMTAVFTIRPDLSFPMIGKIFMRDHTTILSAVKKMKGRKAA